MKQTLRYTDNYMLTAPCSAAALAVTNAVAGLSDGWWPHLHRIDFAQRIFK